MQSLEGLGGLNTRKAAVIGTTFLALEWWLPEFVGKPWACLAGSARN